ncbi:M23 family metallopeptidase [Geofilum sp. OHC36d9]|uniref:M23 family metallopeptidase n=1 Tax=Geofilum sp. OHC36d9 TaxID=3458413 RepID=UPI004033A50B
MRKISIVAAIVLFILIVASSVYVVRWRTQNDLSQAQQDSLLLADIPPPIPPAMLYGFIEDSFQIKTFKVARNQNLAEMLLRQNVDYQIINTLAEKSREVFDVRHIRVGNPYSVFYSRDTLMTPLWLVYEIDNIDYLVMQLTDSLNVFRDQKVVSYERRRGMGVIESSLWNTITENNLNPMLAIELSEIYAWTVDFFGIEKGDYFKVVYDESFVDSVSVGIESIHAAYFMHKGRPYYAFRYQQDSLWSFFDEAGNSLRKAFLKAPLKFSRISSRFSNSRFHPVLKIYRAHHGVDYAAPSGTPVYALGDGTITRRGWDPKGGGNYIKIRHNSVYTTEYMHLSGFAKGLHQGDFVRQSDLIGYVGKTGLATGPHLDFRVFKNGKAIDPLKMEAPPVKPIDSVAMASYIEFIRPLKEELDAIVDTEDDLEAVDDSIAVQVMQE